MPVTLFATLALATLTRIAAEPEAAARWRTWAVAGLLAGLGISTHYYAAILAVPFAAVAAADISRSGRWQTSAGLLIAAGLATVAGFVLGSPFFVLEPGVILRDFTELRQVDIDRAVGSGLFSSIDTYGALLPRAMGWPTVVLALAGILSMLWRDWRRALPLAVFPLAFMVFVANTFPASRYLNIIIPTVAVAAACGAAGLLRVIRPAASLAFAAVVVLAAIPAACGQRPMGSLFRTARHADPRGSVHRTRSPAGNHDSRSAVQRAAATIESRVARGACARTSAMRRARPSGTGCSSPRRLTRRRRSACCISVKAARRGSHPAMWTRCTSRLARLPAAMSRRSAPRASAWWC